MRNLITLLFIIVFSCSSLNAQQCELSGIQAIADDLIYIINNKDQLQADLVNLNNQSVVADLLDDFNASLVSLGDKTGDNLYELFIVYAPNYCGYDHEVVDQFMDLYCPAIDVSAVNASFEIVSAARAILNISDSPSTELTNKVKDLPTGTLLTIINDAYNSCGSRLNLSTGTDPDVIITDPYEETPGFCSTSPFANLTDFLWKPASEKNGNLVILTNPASSVTVNGETLVEFGASNGFCSTVRASRSGASYGNAYVTVTTANQLYVIIIPNGSQRYDCKGSLSVCGIDVYDESELTKLNKKFKKLKKKMRRATDKRRKKRFKNKMKKIKPIIKVAKSQGF